MTFTSSFFLIGLLPVFILIYCIGDCKIHAGNQWIESRIRALCKILEYLVVKNNIYTVFKTIDNTDFLEFYNRLWKLL